MSDHPLASVEAEAALLGALMIEPKLIDGIAEGLEPADFSEQLHGRIFDTITREHSKGRGTSPVALRASFDGDPEMKEVGGPGYLGQLTGSGAALIGAMDFADQVRELSQRRRFVEGMQAAIAAASECEKPLVDLAVLADNAASCVRDAGDSAGEYTAAAAVQLVIDGFDKPVTGALCGVIPSIDALLGPMRPTHLVIGAGRPGMGKTATASSYALGAAERGHGVLVISLEMSAEQLAERMVADLCMEKGIPHAAIRDRTLTPEQKREVCRAHERIKALPLQILDKQGLTVGRIRTTVRRWKRRFAARGHKLELVIVDYLQLVRPDRKDASPYETVSEASRSFKEIAKEEGLCVFALSQLSRAVEQRPDKRPMLSDLRESGQIEQDADAVIFFLRLEYYLRQDGEPADDEKRVEWEKALDACAGRIEFICAKRRAGETGRQFGDFLAPFQAVR
jgi:replicative DNA helicase